ncbi:MAG TPA: hypothetical protein VKK61_07845, partial [Tepidisphaeraceae bacterium]|nr:hypothetical protein [Tepidisphaeraceae bacterium]
HMSIIVGLWAGIALVMWQSQEALRRTLMAHLRFRAAMLGDTISYLGQFAVIIWLAEHNSLTLTTAFQTMALTSALSAILQASQIGLQKTSINQLLSFSKECWSTGRWVLFGNLTDFFSGAMFSWNLAYWAGYEMLGIYNALTNLLRLANPVSLTIGTLITPTAARAHERSGEERAKIVAIRFTLLGGLLLAPYLGLLIIWPKLLIALFYSWNSPYMIYAPVVQIFAAAVAFVYLAISAGAFLNAVHRTRQAFVGQLIYATGFLFVVMPLTAQFGLYGAAWGWLAIASIRAGIYFYFVGSLMPDERQRHDLPLEQQPEMAGIGQIE